TANNKQNVPLLAPSRFSKTGSPALYTLLKIACRAAGQSGRLEFRIGPIGRGVTERFGHARRSRDASRAPIGLL
ncbi:Hypothetical predicted protein, partial [Podarcis lilfordi]